MFVWSEFSCRRICERVSVKSRKKKEKEKNICCASKSTLRRNDVTWSCSESLFRLPRKHTGTERLLWPNKLPVWSGWKTFLAASTSKTREREKERDAPSAARRCQSLSPKIKQNMKNIKTKNTRGFDRDDELSCRAACYGLEVKLTKLMTNMNKYIKQNMNK